ncbi:DNA repair protein RecN [Conchiformibius kuhniae]|uniref:DNA repair protein RecN n=1 Tax=Conchiformibius kuhniae TaxID=211502 RepID=A0A8T9MWL5_9NEIS|nr:DNA repair protein RecN [Conchiformibius kuhniae]
MLLSLSLHNFVLVEQLHLNFQQGFTVLTGETGAGKSLTLDALALLLGGKADFGQIRHGAKEAQLAALFDLDGADTLKAQLREQGLLDEDGTQVSLRRIIDAKGKSRSFINNHAATLAQLKQVGQHLIDVHGQNAHHSLNREAAQRQLLDAFAGNGALADETRRRYQAWQDCSRQLQQAHDRAESLALERERLEWQAGELEKLATYAGEWESINLSHDRLAHAAALLQAAAEAEAHIGGEQGLQHTVARCMKILSPLAHIEPRFAECLDMLAAVEAEAGEIVSNLGAVAAQVELNPAELAAQEERIAQLMSAARKYRTGPEHLPAKLDEIRTALANLEAAADVDALQRQCRDAEAAYRKTAGQLSQRRREAAERLSAQTLAVMRELAMGGARFQIELPPSEPAAHGLEQIRFQIAANQGAPLRPLNKAASGGELARISLALQTAVGQFARIPTLIFDEVDTGIGGGTAETVGRLLRDIGTRHQVLAVTHLPQVAAYGEHHWRVSKHSRNGQTFSRIDLLDTDGRTAELARMLGGEILTDTTRRHAAEMLAAAQNHMV